MPAERPAGWLERVMARLRRDATDATDGDRLRARIKRPKAVRRLDGISSELDRLQNRYGDPPAVEAQDGR